MIKSKKLVKKSVKVVGRGKTDKVIKSSNIVTFKYVRGFEGLKKLEGKVIGYIQKLKSYNKVVGNLPLKSSSQVIPILQLHFLGKIVKGKKVIVQSDCKKYLGIIRDNFSLRLYNLYIALNDLKLSTLKIKRSDCKFVENSKNRILEFTMS